MFPSGKFAKFVKLPTAFISRGTFMFFFVKSDFQRFKNLGQFKHFSVFKWNGIYTNLSLKKWLKRKISSIFFLQIKLKSQLRVNQVQSPRWDEKILWNVFKSLFFRSIFHPLYPSNFMNHGAGMNWSTKCTRSQFLKRAFYDVLISTL